MHYDARALHLLGEAALKLKKLALAAEVVASFGVIITLVLLLLEVRGNTLTMERQIEMTHFKTLFTSFIEPSVLMSAMTKIKAVDGSEVDVAAFMATYDMSEAEAIAWSRFQLIIWAGIQQRFVYDGPSDRLAAEIRQLMKFPDVALFLKHSQFSEELTAYIEQVGMDSDLQ